MGRKFTLRNRERYYGKPRKTMTVRVPRSRVMIYPVSVALDLVKLPSTSNVDAISLDQLSSMIVDHVPSNWSFVKGPATLAFASFSTDSDRPRMSFCLTIHEDFSWELLFEDMIVPPQSLFTFKRKLTSISCILGVLNFLDNKAPTMLCIGNDDEKFKSLPQYAKGVFLGVKGIVCYY